MEKSKRLAIITTHPIQYNAPFFKKLATCKGLTLMVFYTWDKGTGIKHDPGFGKEIEWDIPLLEGYPYTFVKNTSKDPGSHHFRGIQNPTLVDKVKAFQPDAILVYGWCFNSHLKAMRYFSGKTSVWFRGDSHLLNETPGIKSCCRRLALKWIYRHVDRAFYVGENNKDYYIKHGLLDNQLVLMPHAVDNAFFQTKESESKKEAEIVCSKHNIPADSLKLLYAGKFDAVKNLSLLVDAVQHLNRNNKIETKIHLILVGSGMEESHLRKKTGASNYIHFLPFQNQSSMPVIYRLCDFVVLPSKSETWGLMLNEAMACGKPVIASNKVGGAKDLILENKTGLTFNNNNQTDLEKVILSACNWKKKGIDATAIKEHIANFSIENNATMILNQLMLL